MKLGNNLDFALYEARNIVLQNLSAAPSGPKAGQLYWNTTTSVGYVWNGASWRPLDTAALADGSIKIAALEVDPRARSTHTGTQLVATISDFDAAVRAYRLDQFAAPTAAVAWGNQRITAMADPSGAQDGATKAYVDNAVQSAAAGIDSKPSVRVVATGNITLSGLQTIDGISLAVGDRVLAAGQTTGSQNGAYAVASGVWSRAVDADQTGEITPGAFWFVEEGSTYGKTQWRCNNAGTITLGTTAISIVQFGAANLYAAGNGLSLTGSTFAVQLASNSGLAVSASGLAVDTTAVARKYAVTLTGDGGTTSFTLTHNLGTQDITVSVRDSGNAAILVDWTATTQNTATVTFGSAPATGTTYRAVVIG